MVLLARYERPAIALDHNGIQKAMRILQGPISQAREARYAQPELPEPAAQRGLVVLRPHPPCDRSHGVEVQRRPVLLLLLG